MAELDAWDEDGIRLIRATLKRRFPEQASFVLSGIAPATGMASVLTVARLLGRLNALENNPERKGSAKVDRAALDVLAARGITPEKRAALQSLVDTAKSATPVEAVDTESADRERLAALVALRAWYEEWAEVGRAIIHRRDHLIRLGLAARRVNRPSDDEAPAQTEDSEDSDDS